MADTTHINENAVLRVADGLDVLTLSEDEVLIQFGSQSSPSELLRDEDMTGYLAPLFRGLMATRYTFKELLASVPDPQKNEVVTLLTELIEDGLITTASVSSIEQYLGYTFTEQPRIDGGNVLIIGNGPLGGRIAVSLFKHRAGTLNLLDDRIASNEMLGGLLPFRGTGEFTGQSIAQAVSSYLNEWGSEIAVPIDGPPTIEVLDQAIQESDFVVLAYETPAPTIAHLVNRLTQRHQVPWFLTTIDGNLGLIGPLFVPGDTACYNCFIELSNSRLRSARMSKTYLNSLRRSRTPASFVGLPFYADLVAAYAAAACVHFFIRRTSFAVGRMLEIDFDRMILNLNDVLRLPRCPICNVDRPPFRPTFPPEILSQFRDPPQSPNVADLINENTDGAH